MIINISKCIYNSQSAGEETKFSTSFLFKSFLLLISFITFPLKDICVEIKENNNLYNFSLQTKAKIESESTHVFKKFVKFLKFANKNIMEEENNTDKVRSRKMKLAVEVVKKAKHTKIKRRRLEDENSDASLCNINFNSLQVSAYIQINLAKK